jgi:hypothetical protein
METYTSPGSFGCAVRVRSGSAQDDSWTHFSDAGKRAQSQKDFSFHLYWVFNFHPFEGPTASLYTHTILAV